MTQKPAVGRIVHVLTDQTANNGSDVCPAMIVRVWSDEVVNLRLLRDATPSPVEWKTSAHLYEDQDAAEADIKKKAEAAAIQWAGGEHAARQSHRNSGMYAFWPPRV